MLGWKKGIGFSFGPEPTPDAPARGVGEAPEAAGQAAAAATGETDYRLSWLPLGGYVKMLGQDDMDPTQLSEDPRAFNRRPIWQRMCIISAGVVMNIILAFVLFAITFRVGIEFPAAAIGPVEYGSPAAKAGFEMGDSVQKINGQAPRFGKFEFTDVAIASMLAPRGEVVHYTVQRPDGTQRTLAVVPEMDAATGLQRIGVSPMPSLKVALLKPGEESLLSEIDPALGKLRNGDVIVAANGQPVHDFVQLHALIQRSAGQPVTLTLRNARRGVPEQTITLRPELQTRFGAEGPVSVVGMLPQVVVDRVVPNSPAAAAGVQSGDTVVRVEATAYPSFEQFTKIVSQNEGEPISIEVRRKGQSEILRATPRSSNGKVQVGVALNLFAGPARVSEVLPGSLAAERGVRPGAVLMAIDGTPVQSWPQVVAALWQVPEDGRAELSVRNLDGTTIAIVAPAAQLSDLSELQFQLGVPLSIQMQLQQGATVMGAVWMGLDHTEKFVLQTYMTLRGLFQQTVAPSNLHGIVGIAKIGADAQERGFLWLLYIMGLVSVNLAVVNFLPLPIVDGGLFVLLVIEKIRGKPLEAKVLSAINIAGLALLGCIFVFVTFNDITMFLPK
jgi:regulator of sigma E protease